MMSTGSELAILALRAMGVFISEREHYNSMAQIPTLRLQPCHIRHQRTEGTQPICPLTEQHIRDGIRARTETTSPSSPRAIPCRILSKIR